MSNKEEKKITEYFSYLFKYPILIDIFNSMSNASELLTITDPLINQYKKIIKLDDNNQDELSDNTHEILIDNFKHIENQIIKIESKKIYQYPTFNFDYDLINEYVTKSIRSVAKKLDYLNYVLSVYPEHVKLRENKLLELINGLPEGLKFGNLAIKISNSLKSDIKPEGLHYFIQRPPLQFHIRINHLIEYYQHKLNIQNQIRASRNVAQPSYDNAVGIQGENLNKRDITEIVKSTISKTLDSMQIKPGYRDDDFLTAGQVMEYLNISRATYERWANTGKIKKEYVKGIPGTYFSNVKNLPKK